MINLRNAKEYDCFMRYPPEVFAQWRKEMNMGMKEAAIALQLPYTTAYSYEYGHRSVPGVVVLAMTLLKNSSSFRETIEQKKSPELDSRDK